jgi:hypothetical protein
VLDPCLHSSSISDPGDQILLKNSKCSEFIQIEQEHMPRRHEPNTTRLGSNRHRMREISRSVKNAKQVKKRDADCTVRTDADMACPYDTWKR